MQVCIPGLHINLGVFYKLFTLLEAAAHELDILYCHHYWTWCLSASTRQAWIRGVHSGTADGFSPEAWVTDDAVVIRDCFITALTFFGRCHNIYSTADSMEDEITQLDIIIDNKALLDKLSIKHVVNSFTTEIYIKEFLTFYRTELPTARVTPKLHMLDARHSVDTLLGCWHWVP